MPSEFVSTPTTQRAVTKPHRCSWCGESIPIGGLYVRWSGRYEGQMFTCKVHTECRTAMEVWQEQTGEIEYPDVGSMTRGCTCEKGDVRHGTYPSCILPPAAKDPNRIPTVTEALHGL